jgi:hypothetical protein
MQRRKKYVKALAFVPAIVLVGSFVGCQAGAFRMFSEPEPAPQAPANPPPAAQPSADTPPVFMVGTKSIGNVIPTAGVGSTPSDPLQPRPNAPILFSSPPQP